MIKVGTPKHLFWYSWQHDLTRAAEEGEGGAGSAFYPKENISYVTSIEMKIDGKVESVWVENVKAKVKLNFLGGVIYQLPNTGQDATSAVLQEVNRASRYCIVCCGDIHYRTKN